MSEREDRSLAARALYLLDLLRHPDALVPRWYDDKSERRVRDMVDDDGWFSLKIYNVGAKTIAELIAAGELNIRRGYKIGQVEYRLAKNRHVVVGEDEQDFGDLWVADA
jgi:hypothetical protein